LEQLSCGSALADFLERWRELGHFDHPGVLPYRDGEAVACCDSSDVSKMVVAFALQEGDGPMYTQFVLPAFLGFYATFRIFYTV